MSRWRVDYLGSKGKHLGTVEARDEKAAIAEAMKDVQHHTRSAVLDHGDEDRRQAGIEKRRARGRRGLREGQTFSGTLAKRDF